MNNLSLFALLSLVVHVGAGCAETTVTFITQAPPGRTATVDVATETLTLSRGLAVAFDCVEWTEAYSGPCRAMTVTFDDDTIGENVPAHLDAFAGQRSFSQSEGFDDAQTVGGPTDWQGGVVLGLAEGTTTMTVTSGGAPIALTLEVVAPPAPPAPDDAEEGDDG